MMTDETDAPQILQMLADYDTPAQTQTDDTQIKDALKQILIDHRDVKRVTEIHTAKTLY